MIKEHGRPAEPIGWMIKIKMDKPMEKTQGGIFLPETTTNRKKYRIEEGVVVALGPLAYTNERFEGKPWCQLGDRVLVSENIGYYFTQFDNDYKFINDEDIRANFGPEPEEKDNAD